MIDPDQRIGYVRMTNFAGETTRELAAVMKTLRQEHGLRGLILDLRRNPGGLLQAAVEVTNLFLEGDKEIVSTRDQRGRQDMQMFTSEPEGEHYPDIPMIVLVSQSSASASEIVTGALQAHHRALVVGARTFGKGSVQQVLDVTRGRREAFLKLTTAWYYLPNGRCLHRQDDAETWGVDPDVEMKLVPKEIIKVANMQLRKDILKGRNQEELTDEDYEKVFSTQPSATDKEHEPGGDSDDEAQEDSDDDEVARKDPNEWPELDPQLETALLLIRVRLETNHPWPLHPQEVAATPAPETGG
jgi:carboxyl-terminal processing protease